MEHGESLRGLSGHYLKGTPGAVSPDEQQGVIVTDDPDGMDNCMAYVGIGDAVFPC